MMEKMQTNQWDNVRWLLQAYSDTAPTFVYAVLDGYLAGDVYADNSREPGSLLVEAPNKKFYVCGKADSKAIALIKNALQAKERNKCRLFSSDESWDRVIEADMSSVFFKKTLRTWLPFDSGSYASLSHYGRDRKAAKNIVVQPLTKTLIHLSETYPESYYTQNWGDVSAFLKHGYGYCAVINGGIAAECTSVYRSRCYAEAAVYTRKDFQGRGLALMLVHKFITTSMENNLIPRWDCDTSNFASMKLARKLGFKQGSVYSMYHL